MTGERTGYVHARYPKTDSASGGGSQRMRIKSIADDHLVCRALNGATEGNSDVYVAKPWLLRRTPFDGGTGRGGYTYVYSDSQNRISDNGSDTEAQTMIPVYLVDDEIAAIRMKTGLEDSPNYLDLNVDGRYWAAESTE